MATKRDNTQAKLPPPETPDNRALYAALATAVNAKYNPPRPLSAPDIMDTLLKDDGYVVITYNFQKFTQVTLDAS